MKTKLSVLLLALLTSTLTLAQDVKVKQVDTLIKDQNMDGKAGPGDSIRYKVTISVSGDSAKMVTLDTINPDSNLVVDPGSIHISPLARKDSFECLGNVGLDVPIAGLLGNDKDIDGGTLVIDSAGGLVTNTATMVDFTTTRGGTANVKMDGSFTYTPPPGYEGRDTFRYELSDGDPITSNRDALVCILISEVIVFVNNANPSPGNGGKGYGTMADPYVDFSLINGSNGIGDEDSTGAVIFLYAGNSPTATMEYTRIELEDNQTLIGEGALESIMTITGISPPMHSLSLPSTGGVRPVIRDPQTNQEEEGIELANDNDIRGLIVRNGGARGIQGVDVGGTTIIKNVRLENNALEEIFLIRQTGSFTFQDDTIICSIDDGILISQGSADIDFINTKQIHSNQAGVRITGSDADVSFTGGSSIQQTGGTGIYIATCTGTYEFDSLTVVGGVNGINMISSGTATLTVGYTNIQSSGGTGINASGGGTLNITDATSVVNSTSGKALDLDGSTLGVTLASVISMSSPSSGIELDNIGGILTINGGSITGATGTAYDVGGTSNNSGGNATVVYAGTINNTAGRAVLIQELNGGSHTLSGNITHNASAEGIQVSEINNGPSASVTFSGPMKMISSGSSHAVDLNTNTNGTINFTNGGLDIDVSSGTGFNAMTGGTINVSGVGNTIDVSGNGRSLVCDLVTIGGNNVSFSTINQTGAGATNTPISFLNVSGSTFNGGNVDVNGTGGTADGISIASSGATFNFTSATIDNTGDAGINLTGANGTVTFTTVDIDGTLGNGIDIADNTNAVNFNGGSIGASNTTTGNAVDVLRGNGAINVAAFINNSSNRAVEVTNRTGGSVDFNGAISCTATGINLNTNGSGTVTFKGGLSLNTGGNTAFTAIGGGTVNVCEDTNCSVAGGTPVVNNIGASPALTATAVNITGTTIGSENVIFQSIRTSGSSNGIILNNTGSLGGLVVTGVNGPCGNTNMAKDCDGGYIRNTSGDAILLTNTSKFSLSNFEISGSAANGIKGVTVTDFSLINCDVLNNGDAVNEGGLRFDQNLFGTCSLNGTLITGSAEHNIEIINNSGNLTQLNINNSRISSNSMTLGADGLLLELMSSATANVVVTNSEFDDNKSDGIQISTLGTSSASISVTGSTFNLGARGINLSNGNSSELTFDIGGNMMSMGNNFSNFSPTLGEEAINLAVASTSTSTAELEGNIKFNTFTNSGGAIGVDTRGDGIATFDFSNNTAASGMNRQIFDIITGDSPGDAPTLNLTMLDNNLGPTNLAVEVVSIEFTRDSKACLNIMDNMFTRTGTGDGIVILDDTNTGPTNPEIKLEQNNNDCSGSPCATAELQIEATNTILPSVQSAVDNMTLVMPGTCPTPMFP